LRAQFGEAAGADLAIAGRALANLPGLSGRGERLTVATPDGGSALLALARINTFQLCWLGAAF